MIELRLTWPWFPVFCHCIPSEITRRERTQLSDSFTTTCYSTQHSCLSFSQRSLYPAPRSFGQIWCSVGNVKSIHISQEQLWAFRNRHFIPKPFKESLRFNDKKNKSKTHRNTVMAGDDLSGALLASSITVISLTTVLLVLAYGSDPA